MSAKSRVRAGGWRWLFAGAVVIGMELWLLITKALPMDGLEFEVLCAFSCWLPAWFCADLLSTPRSDAATHRERSVREVVGRGIRRLLPSLLVLGLWCGTYTLRTLQAELLLPNPRMMSNIDKATDLVPVWIAWTTVFLASGFAYGAGAGLCSAMARRPRRWLIAPAVVVGASLFLNMVTWGLSLGMGGLFPFQNNPSPVEATRHILTVPNYTVGSATALITLNFLSNGHEELFSRLTQHVPQGIAIFCWIATLLFLLIGTACSVGILWIARNRHRRHPNTALDPVTPDHNEMCVPQPG